MDICGTPHAAVPTRGKRNRGVPSNTTKRADFATAAAALIASFALFASFGAWAQAYPSKQIRLIIPFVAGASSNDIIGRALALKLAPGLGQAILVENRPGQAGNMGSEMVSKSTPDGYTLLLAINGPIAISPSVYPDLGYDSTRDLTPVALIAKVPYMVGINPQVPAKNVKEIIALVKARPGEINFGTTGSGGTPHLCIELLMSIAGLKMVHVPYKGGAQTMTDLVGGQVQMYCAGYSAMMPLVKAGKVRAIGSATLKRSELLPELQTFIEQGIPDFEVGSWLGIMGPAKMPQPIARRLYDEVARTMATADMKNYLISQGAEAALMAPDEFGAYVKTEIAKWAKVVKAAGVKPGAE